jgi:hypothetical protein
LDASVFVEIVVTIGGPWPVFGFLYEAASDGVAVHVRQFFDSLIVGEDVEVVVTSLPEGFLGEAL